MTTTGGKSDLIGGNYEYMQVEVFLSVHGCISIPHRGLFSKQSPRSQINDVAVERGIQVEHFAFQALT